MNELVGFGAFGVYAANLVSPSLLANTCTFFVINCIGWWKWRANGVGAAPGDGPGTAAEGGPR